MEDDAICDPGTKPEEFLGRSAELRESLSEELSEDYDDEGRPSLRLFVLVHGNNAGPDDWLPFEALLDGSPSVILRASSNAYDTHGGIGLLGRRLADEIVRDLLVPNCSGEAQENDVVYECLDGSECRLPDACVHQLYFMAHSLGGLVSRWCIGHLHATGVLRCVRPCTYVSVCSPHLGVRAPGWYLPRNWINLAGSVPLISGHQTELEMVFNDGQKEGCEPLLATLADPEQRFIQGLGLFERLVCLGLTAYDTLVPVATACICAGSARLESVDGAWSASAVPALFYGTDAERVPQQWAWPRDEIRGWCKCTAGEVNLPLQVLDGLATLHWERVLVTAPPSALMRKTAHDFPIGKQQPAGHAAMCQESQRMLVRLLCPAAGEAAGSPRPAPPDPE